MKSEYPPCANRFLYGMPLWLFGLTVLLRAVIFILTIRFPDFCLFGDSPAYLDLAHQIWSTHSYSYTGLVSSPALLFPPGYSFLLAPFTTLGSRAVLTIAFSQSVLGVVSVCWLWRWLLMIGDRRAAIWGTTFFAADWTLLAHTPAILADGVMLFALILAFYQFWKAMHTLRPVDILWSGLFWGIAPMFKPVSLYLPLLVSWVWIRVRKAFWVFVIAFSIIPLCWMSRNYYVSQHFVFSTMGGRHLLDYTASYIEALRLKRSLGPMKEELRQRVEAGHPQGFANETETNEAYAELGWSILKAHPFYFILQNGLGVVKLLAGTGVDMFFDLISKKHEVTIRMAGSSPMVTGQGTVTLLRAHPALIAFQILYSLELAALYGFFARGLWKLWRSGRRIEALLLIESVVYFLALVGHVGYYRFRLLLMPLLAAGVTAGASGATTGIREINKELDV